MSDPTSYSRSFKLFLHAYFDPLTYEEWRGGVGGNGGYPDRLSLDEQILAENLLFQKLEQGSTDIRIVLSLGILRSQRAIPLLKNFISQFRGMSSATEPAIALWKI